MLLYPESGSSLEIKLIIYLSTVSLNLVTVFKEGGRAR